jgi:hypothetical protein
MAARSELELINGQVRNMDFVWLLDCVRLLGRISAIKPGRTDQVSSEIVLASTSLRSFSGGLREATMIATRLRLAICRQNWPRASI